MLYSGNPLVNNSSSWYELYRVDADFDITYAVIELTKTYFYFDHYTPSSDSISSLVGNSITLVHADEYNAYITAYGSPYLYWRIRLNGNAFVCEVKWGHSNAAGAGTFQSNVINGIITFYA